MAGFDPIGSAPVASIGSATLPGLYFSAVPGVITINGFAASFTMAVPPPQIKWLGLEILRTAASGTVQGKVLWAGLEVVRVAASGTVFALPKWVGIEVIRSRQNIVPPTVASTFVPKIMRYRALAA